MKRFVCILLVVVMVLSLIPLAVRADETEYTTVALGDNEVHGGDFIWTAEADGQLTVTISKFGIKNTETGDVEWCPEAYLQQQFYRVYSLLIDEVNNYSNTATVDVTAGQEVIISLSGEVTADEDIYATMNLSFGEGTASGGMTLGLNTFEIAASDADGETMTYTAEKDGTLVASVTSMNYLDTYTETYQFVPTEYLSSMLARGQFTLMVNDEQVYGSVTAVEVKAGDEVKVNFFCFYGNEATAVIKLRYAEATEIARVYGSGRWDTSLKVADEMKTVMGIEKFDAVIIASGNDFADALAGSYLSAAKSAPILLCWNGDAKYNYLNDNILTYIDNNLAAGGTVYILGGKGAVPMSFDEKLQAKGVIVDRLAGGNRFATNLMILEKAGVSAEDEILVCTSTNFADSLSASATGKPILLVYNEGGKLFDDQKEALEKLSGCTFTIIGGYGAVSEKMEGLISAYGEATRLAGSNRFETSVLVAQRYFSAPENVVVAYAWNYPDGLCGGSLAYAMNAPLILTMDRYETAAAEYMSVNYIAKSRVLGGTGLISDAAVEKIFG